MLIRNHINVKDTWLLDGLRPVVDIMSQVEASGEGEVTIDFADTQFVSPVFALSLIVYLTRCGKHVTIINPTEYLGLIGMADGGIKPDRMRQTEFLATMEKYASKTYIPIIDFAAERNSDAKEAVSSLVENMLISQLNIERNVAIGFKYGASVQLH